MSAGVLLHLHVRHEPGALARIVSILNPFPVTQLHYAVHDDGLAHAGVRLDADEDLVARVLRRLERVVPVLAVIAHPEVASTLPFSGGVPSTPVTDEPRAPICV